MPVLFPLCLYARRTPRTHAAVHAGHLHGTSPACLSLFPDIQHHWHHHQHASFPRAVRSVMRQHFFPDTRLQKHQKHSVVRRTSLFLSERSNKTNASPAAFVQSCFPFWCCVQFYSISGTLMWMFQMCVVLLLLHRHYSKENAKNVPARALQYKPSTTMALKKCALSKY